MQRRSDLHPDAVDEWADRRKLFGALANCAWRPQSCCRAAQILRSSQRGDAWRQRESLTRAGVALNGTFDPAVVRKYAERITQGRWFVNLGLPFDEREQGTVEAFVRATGAAKAVRATSWEHAYTIVTDGRAQADAENDAAEVERLKARALVATDRPALMTTMTTIVDGGLEIFFDRAGAAARAARVSDPAVIRIAASAASEAVYRAALAAAVGEPDTHWFILRYELFTNGRWPLARIDDGFYLF